MKKVYLFLADGFEMIEGLTVVDILRRAGIEIKMVSLNDTLEVVSSHKVCVKADCFFHEMKESEAAMYVLPGGLPGTNHLMSHDGLRELLLSSNENGVELAAICAAPSVLGKNGLLKGKKATCYPGFEDQLLEAVVVEEGVVATDGVITGRGMGESIPFALAIVERLVGQEKAKTIADSIQYSKY